MAGVTRGRRSRTWYGFTKYLMIKIIVIVTFSHTFTVAREQPFKDKCFLYRFKIDEENTSNTPQIDDVNSANDHVREHLPALLHRGPDATLRMILRKP